MAGGNTERGLEAHGLKQRSGRPNKDGAVETLGTLKIYL